MGKYGKFAAMTATSTVVMFGLMYLNTYQLDHLYFSETRAYMAVVMGATMAGIMLGFMLNMYNNRKTNISIFVGSILVFVLSAVPNSKIQTFWDGSRRLSVISQWRVKKYCYEWVCSVSTGPA